MNYIHRFARSLAVAGVALVVGNGLERGQQPGQ